MKFRLQYTTPCFDGALKALCKGTLTDPQCCTDLSHLWAESQAWPGAKVLQLWAFPLRVGCAGLGQPETSHFHYGSKYMNSTYFGASSEHDLRLAIWSFRVSGCAEVAEACEKLPGAFPASAEGNLLAAPSAPNKTTWDSYVGPFGVVYHNL